MDTQWIIDLASLKKTGNFSHAALLNNISQSAFSRRIKSFEAWVGTLLVDRSSHPVILTSAGEQILEAGNQALTRIENERKLILDALAQPDKYVVRFAAQHSIGWRFYPTWLQAIEESFGPILSRLRADDLENCVSDLNRGEVDFVISYESEHARGIYPSPDFESLIIGRDQLIPICKPDAEGKPMYDIDGGADTTIPFLRFGPSAPIGWNVEPILKSRNMSAKLIPIYENSLSGALRIRARNGLGVAWLPYTMVEPDIEAKLLTWAGTRDWAIDVDIRLHRLMRNHNTLIRNLWTFLQQRENQPLN